MEFDLTTVVDGVFDYDLMENALDAYDDTLTASQCWTHIHDECIESALLHTAELPLWIWDPDSQACSSFDTCSPIMLAPSGSGSMPLAPPSLAEVLSRLEYDVQLLSWGVCTWWCNILTPHTHAYLVLSLPDRWTDIVPFNEPEDVSTFLGVFAMETEIDMSATIVKHNIVICGVRFRNWPIFPYNFFLHLCPEVETVIFKDHGSRPYMTPYKKGACFYPYRCPLPSACMHSSLFNPPPMLLQYLKLDILRDPYGIRVTHQQPQLNLTGGFVLVHQLFQSALGHLQYGLFVDDNETFPLQTTQYYGDALLLWPGMSQSLTTLTIQISEHHSGGSVSSIDLNGLAALLTLNLHADDLNLGVLVQGAAHCLAQSQFGDY
ncbi:hypothetical protein IW262DRAFT_1302608 [Armillaria fumosa]|nr:hypothetical protein IW262DRAFT_1302608 [Armillaria fumosa]